MFDERPKVNKPNRLPANPEKGQGRFPSWLHRKLPKGEALFETNAILQKHRLNTVCEEAKCPNRFECYSKKTATFLVLGKECTRQCGFCDIDFSKMPAAPDPHEPERIAECVRDLGLKHVVITMVARDDLPDGGADHLVHIVQAIRKSRPEGTIELLTSDFDGNWEALKSVLNEPVEVFNHNIETVRRLTPRIRYRAEYDRTLEVLSLAKKHSTSYVKSGMMLGFGETKEEVKETIRDLKEAGCDIITIGQYLQASRSRALVKAFISPEEFKFYEEYGHSIGVRHMYCGPFVRSSYNADLLTQSL
ncbi:MAG: lipoyl synthase [Simkaniaceae bacterium]|nr:lipoyl synthase [Simkaniaceae bacterium]